MGCKLIKHSGMRLEVIEYSKEDITLMSCTGPDEVFILPDNIKTICRGCFNGGFCPRLKKIVLPENTTAKFDFSSFRRSPTLSELEVNPNNTEFTSQDGVVFSHDLDILYFYPPNKSDDFEIPKETSTIASCAFESCKALTKIHIPENVKRIERDAFNECANLSEVILGNGLEYLDVFSFHRCNSLKSLKIPGSVSVVSRPSWKLAIVDCCAELEYVEFEEGVKEIHSHTLENCKKLARVSLPMSLEKIHKEAFLQCENLKEIVIPAELFTNKKVIQNLNKEAKLIAKEDGRILRDPDSLKKPEVKIEVIPASQKKGNFETVWALCELLYSFKQCSVALKSGKTYAYGSNYAIKPGNIAIIGTAMKENSYSGVTSGQLGEISEVAQQFTGNRKFMYALDFAFTDSPTAKTLNACENILKCDPSEADMCNDAGTGVSYVLHPITFLTKQVFAALTLLSYADQAKTSGVEMAKQFLLNDPCNDDFMQKIECIQNNPCLIESFEFNFWEQYFPNTEELKASLDSLVNRGMLKTGNFYDEARDPHIYYYNKPSKAIIKYMNECIWAGAINVMVQANMLNLLDVLLQVRPKLKPQVNKIKELHQK